MLLAHEKGAELIVAVGTHFNLIEFLERNRAGMSSTFLTRLRVGEILVDAKGVSRLVAPARRARAVRGARFDRARRDRGRRARRAGRAASDRADRLRSRLARLVARAWRPQRFVGLERSDEVALDRDAVQATRELLAPRPDVWGFVAEPFPSRRLVARCLGRAAGPARIGRRCALGDRGEPRADAAPQARRERDGSSSRPPTSRCSSPSSSSRRSSPCGSTSRRSTPTARKRTITVEGPWLIAYRRTLARRAAGRLYDLCQTAARL